MDEAGATYLVRDERETTDQAMTLGCLLKLDSISWSEAGVCIPWSALPQVLAAVGGPGTNNPAVRWRTDPEALAKVDAELTAIYGPGPSP